MENFGTWLALAQPGVSILIAALLALVWRFDTNLRHFMSVSAAFLFYGLGMVMQITLVPAHLPLNIMLSGVVYLSAAVALCHGLVALGGKRAPWLAFSALFALTLAIRAYYTFLEPDNATRVYALQFACAALLVVAGWRVRHFRKGLGSERLLYWLVMGFALSFILRALSTIEAGSQRYGYDTTLYWVVTQITFYGFGICLAVVFLMASASRALHIIRQASYLDPLTGINNRAGFRTLVRAALAGSTYYALIIMDIDHFKKVNDRYGHAVGDKVLVQLARLLSHGLRPDDVAARYGGEEFLIFLPQTDGRTALVVAERLRRSIEQMDLSSIAEGLSCTASFGVSQFDANHTVDQAYRKVDALLYSAKADGRNRIYGDASSS